jgi:hypothetical protein
MTERTRSDLQNMVRKSRTFDNVTAVAILGLGVAFVGFTLNRRAESHLPSTFPKIAKQFVGRELKLPTSDSFHRRIKLPGDRTVLVLSGCNSCSITQESKLKVPGVRSDEVLVTADKSQRKLFEGASHSVIFDLDQPKLIPVEIYDVAPVRIILKRGKYLGWSVCFEETVRVDIARSNRVHRHHSDFGIDRVPHLGRCCFVGEREEGFRKSPSGVRRTDAISRAERCAI